MSRRPLARAVPPPEAQIAPSVVPVRTQEERDAFLEYQLKLYKNDPAYVPPIIAERRDFLDPAKNPFFAHAEVELFLAWDGPTLVGRIAAIDNAHYNEFHDAEVGFFGLFECVDSPIVARALLAAATGWLRRRGLKQLIGPVNLSTNHDCGLLIEGFDVPPAMMMPYNFPYYVGLLDACGLKKAKDLWTYELSTSLAIPEELVTQAERLRAQRKITVRPLTSRDLSDGKRKMKSVYDAMLERIWGRVPMTDEEFDHISSRVKPLILLRPDLSFIAEMDGEPVAFSCTLPDANECLRAANGHLTQYGLPFGLLKMAWAAHKTDRVRVLLLGVKPSLKHLGLERLLYLDTMRAARALGFEGGELGWTFEDEDWLNRSIERMGARRYKTYRLYQREL